MAAMASVAVMAAMPLAVPVLALLHALRLGASLAVVNAGASHAGCLLPLACRALRPRCVPLAMARAGVRMPSVPVVAVPVPALIHQS